MPRNEYSGASRKSSPVTPLILALLFGVLLLVIQSRFGATGLMAGFAASMGAVPLYVGLVLWLDRHEPEPHALLAWAFFWGASGATFLSFVANTLFATTRVYYDPVVADFLGSAFFAPAAEELAKGALLIAFFHWYPDEFDNVTDGIISAAMVGLGFAATENVLYYAAAYAAGPEVLAETWLIRGVASPYAHPLFTAALGLSLGIARERSSDRGFHALAAVTGLTGAILLHASWNLAAITGTIGSFYLYSMVPIFLGFLVLLRRSLLREAEVIRRELRPYVAAGILAPEQLARLSSSSLRFRASARALINGGRRALHDEVVFHQAATELAFQRWRMARGLESGEPAQARIDGLLALLRRS
ncbi:MAG TPA: PrsW family intramembrane metalloprotease [Longimicrobiaceae bacterium]|nr:PrsW family intramembrane metalloprotease [Longimicrobiaceae bacterium]